MHHILKYPEVITDLNFIIIQTTSLEARTGKSLRNPDKEKKDNPYGPSNGNQENVDIRQTTNHRENEVKSPNSLRDEILSCPHRLFTDGQTVTHKDMQLYRTSCKIDLITRFSIRPPELMTIVDMVGKYYRWFNVSSTPLKDNVVQEFLDEDLQMSAWIDAMKCQILL